VIAGIGVDLVEQARIARLLERYGDQFARRVLAEDELPGFAASPRRTAYVANRFAAKEALSKALGTGMRYPVGWHALSVIQDASGRPEMRFHGPLAEYLAERGIARAHVSITHESGLACAVVVLEAGP
jgi:holo-[acyl-carrier protein] synthase